MLTDPEVTPHVWILEDKLLTNAVSTYQQLRRDMAMNENVKGSSDDSPTDTP